MPPVVRDVVSQHPDAPVGGAHLEVPMPGIQPAIEDLGYVDAAALVHETARLFLAAITGVALDVDIVPFHACDLIVLRASHSPSARAVVKKTGAVVPH